MAGSAPVYVGVAGWSVPAQHAALFPSAGSHLQRYAARFNAVEINSSFYRSHRPGTYARWAQTVPEGFRFAVKAPRSITHHSRLLGAIAPLSRWLDDVSALGDRLGPLLVQLPPTLAFAARIVRPFFTALRKRFDGEVVCEPRHSSWFEPAAEQLLARLEIARAAADPAILPAAAAPGGWKGMQYFRLHGSPRVYYSAYSERYLDGLARRLRAAATRAEPLWCIFDNTALGEAVSNALGIQRRLGHGG